MSWPSYSNYRESGVDWLGNVPESWEVTQLRHLCTVATGNKDTINRVEDGQYPFFIRSEEIQRINSWSLDCEAVLTPGDGAVGKVFHHYVGKFDFHQRVYAFYNFRTVLGRFFFYYLSGLFAAVALDGSAKTTVDSLRMPLIKGFQLTFPSAKDDQRKIVAFLDRETAKIDALIAKQEQLIATLREDRTATITHAVTKGLDPHVEMATSDDPMVPASPGHWSQRVPLKRLASVQTGLTLGKAVSSDDSVAVPYLRVANVQTNGVKLDEVKTVLVHRSELPSYLLRTGDVLMTEGGDIDKLGRGCLWRGEISPCIHQNHVFAVRCSDRLNNNFLVYLLDTSVARNYFFMTAKKTTNLASTNSTTLGRFSFALPPLPEQQQIVDFLDARCSDIDNLIAKGSMMVQVLKEYRSALITDAVTGKIDVRGMA